MGVTTLRAQAADERSASPAQIHPDGSGCNFIPVTLSHQTATTPGGRYQVTWRFSGGYSGSGFTPHMIIRDTREKKECEADGVSTDTLKGLYAPTDGTALLVAEGSSVSVYSTANCAPIGDFLVRSASTEIKGNLVSEPPTCTCWPESPHDCSCVPGQVYRFTDECRPQLSVGESKALNKKLLNIDIDRVSRIAYPGTEKARRVSEFSLPQEIRALIKASKSDPLLDHVRMSCYIDPCTVTGDFDGDGNQDRAVLVESDAGKKGILFIHGNGQLLLVGFGRISPGLTPMTADFAWVQAWEAVPFKKVRGYDGAPRPNDIHADVVNILGEANSSDLLYWSKDGYRDYSMGD